MNTRTIGLSRFVAAASAAVITAVGAWAFVSSSASIERDPFRFASIMAANAKVHVAQVQSRTAFACPTKHEARDAMAPKCLGG